jgi:hypothetical protein
MVSPDSRANLARRQAETPLIALFRFPEPALFRSRPFLVFFFVHLRHLMLRWLNVANRKSNIAPKSNQASIAN